MKGIGVILRKVVLVFVIAGSMYGVMQVTLRAGQALRAMHALDFDYTRIRRIYPDITNARFVRQALPPKATIAIHPFYKDIRSVAMRYYAYPVRVSFPGDFIVDLDGTIARDRGLTNSTALLNGARLISRPDAPPLHKPSEDPPRHVWTMFPVVAFVAAGMALIGSLLTRTRYFPRLGPSLSLVFGFLTGNLALISLVWLFLITGGTATLLSVLVLWSAAAGTAFFIFKQASPAKTLKRSPLNSSESRAAFSLFKRGLCLVIPTAAVLMIGGVFILTVASTVVDWDAMSNWIFKAKVIFHTGQLDLSLTHQNWYPLLWPLNIACLFAFMDGMVDPAAVWMAGVFFLAFSILLFHGLRFATGNECLAGLILLFYFSVTVVLPPAGDPFIYFCRADANNIMLAFMTATVIFIMGWFQTGKSPGWLNGALLMSIGMVLTKLEGALIVLLLTAALFLSLDLSRISRKDKLYLVSFLGVSLLPLGWIIWIESAGYANGLSGFSQPLTLGKIAVSGRLIVRYALVNEWVILSAVLAVLVLFMRKEDAWREDDTFLLAVSLGLVLLSLCVGLRYPSADMDSHFRLDFPRMFLYATVPLCFFFAGRLGRRDATNGA